MIQIKNASQIEAMRDAGRITAEALEAAGEMIREGVTTKQIDDRIRHVIERAGAKPSFLGYGGFPASACISVNEEVIHGIPSPKRVLHEGDIVSVDVGAYFNGYHGDSANTFPVGRISAEAQTLIDATKNSFQKALEQAKVDARLGDVGFAVESYVKQFGFSVVKKYVGHGVGRDLHEEPDVPNYGTPGRGVRIYPGMVIAIEPMVTVGSSAVRELANGWTVVTVDGSLAAHYEHTIVITEDGPQILTSIS